jgi:WD40 repeat protein
MAATQLFLSYNSVDRPFAVAVQKLLEGRGITTFLDHDQLVPGLPWPVALENGLRSASAVAVFIGRELGGWQKREMWFALDRQVREEKEGRYFPVIPVLLPGADVTPGFQFVNTWIDVRGGLETVNRESLDAFESAVLSTAFASGQQGSGLLAPESPITICPYRGLEAFREEDAAFFAGRTAFAQELLKFTLGKDLVSVVGPSGSGKSSVVQAGLVPLLRRQLPPATTWDSITFTPGSDPFHRLASALIPLLDPDKDIVERLAMAEELGTNLAGGRARLESVVDLAIQKSNGTGRLLLVADQFEELFTLAPEPCRRPFTRALLGALGKARFTLLVTLRADFYSQIITLDRELSDRLAPAQVNIGALTQDELRQSVTGPAELVGLKFESGLVDRILNDVGNEPGNLPLLEFALTGLWSRRQNRTLRNAAYDDIGGVTGALAQRAEAEFARFTPEEKTAARRLFSRLVRVARPEEGAEDTRQRLNLQATDEASEKVARALAAPNVRLLVMGGPEASREGRQQTVQVAHEALIRNWERLRSWLNEDREFLLWRQRTQVQVEQWDVHRRDPGYLLRGAALSEAEQWLVSRWQDLVTEERDFVGSSVEFRERENEEEKRRRQDEIDSAKRLKEVADARADAEARRAKILRRSLLASGVLLVLALSTAIYAFRERAVARAREFITASQAAEDTDPEFSVLIAAQGIAATWPWGHNVLPEAEQLLHRSIAASHVRLTLRPHRSSITSVAWSPEGKRLVTGSKDKTAKLWDADTGKELLTLSGHSGEVTSVAWSPEGRRLVTGSKDKTAKLWDADTGKELLTLSQSGSVESVGWNRDGQRFATGSDDGKVTVWDVEKGKDLITMQSHNLQTNSVTWSPDGTRLAADGFELDFSVEVWNAATGKELLSISSRRPILSLAWSPDGRYLATGSDDKTVRVSGAERGEELLTLNGHSGEVTSVAWNPDGKRLVTASSDNTVKVWDVGVREEFPAVGHGYVTSMAWSPDSKRLATGSRIWDADTGKELLTLSGHSGEVTSVAWSPEGKRLVTGSEDKTAKLWDADTGKELLTLSGHSGEVTSVAWSAEGKRLATGSWDSTAKIWDADTGKELLTLNGHRAVVGSVAWSPDGKRLATGSRDSTGKIWDADTGKELLTLSGHKEPITSSVGWRVAWSPDGKRLVTASSEQVKVWDPEMGIELWAFDKNGGLVTWSPDGKCLAIADGAVRIYAMDIRDLMAIARQRVTDYVSKESCKRYIHVEECPPFPTLPWW